jgi:hypothetical protein
MTVSGLAAALEGLFPVLRLPSPGEVGIASFAAVRSFAATWLAGRV